MRLKILTDGEIDRALSEAVPTDRERMLLYFDEGVQEADERLRLHATRTAVQRRFVAPREREIAEAEAEQRELAKGDTDDIRRHNALIPYIETKREEIEESEKFLLSPYFARMDLCSDGNLERFYLGKKGNRDLGILDWRAPVAERFYQKSRLNFTVGDTDYQVVLRRSLRIRDGRYKGHRDEYLNLTGFLSEEEIAGRDESLIYDPFLKELLLERKNADLPGDIIQTIQEKQYEVICRPERENVVVQGSAGSGKTMVLLHRLSYLLYNNRNIRPENVLVLTPSESFNEFISELATTLELTRTDTSTTDAYYLSLLEPLVPGIGRLTRLKSSSDSASYRAWAYKSGAGEIAEFLAALENRAAKKMTGDAVTAALGRAKEASKRAAPCYERIKNAPLFVRAAVLGEIREKEDGSFFYTRSFRRMMTEGDLAIEGLGKYAAEKTPLRRAKTLRAAICSLAFVKNHAAGEISGSVRSLRSREKSFEKEAEGMRSSARSLVRYGKNALLAALEERKYLDQALEKDRAADAVRKAVADVETIGDYFRTLRDLLKEIAGDEDAVAFARLSDPAFAVKYLYNRPIAEKKEPLGHFTATDVYLFVSALCRLGYDLKKNHSFLFLDEGQDLSPDEYALLRAINPTAFFNVFGDVAQNVTPYRGLRDWSECAFGAAAYELNRNYRNTVKIVDFVRDEVGIDMLAVGPSGEPVIRKKEDLGAFFRQGKGLRAAIYKGEVPEYFKGREFHLVGRDGKLVRNKINVMTVLECKGLEFTTVAVAARGMTPNEKYIAFTRALARLAAVDDE